MAPERRHPNVVNLSEAEFDHYEHASRLCVDLRLLGDSSGAVGLGCMHHELPVGKAAFALHFHCGVEEALFVLEGVGSLRIGDAVVEVKEGDYVSFPPGPEAAHQLTNTGTGPLKYLGLSTQSKSDVILYGDSQVVGARGGDAPNRWVGQNFRVSDAVPYGFGEK